MFLKLDTIHLFILFLFLIPISWFFIDVGHDHLVSFTALNGPIRNQSKNYWRKLCDEIYPSKSCPQNFQTKLPKWTSTINFFRTNNSFDFSNILLIIHFSAKRYDSAAKVVALYYK